MNVIETKIKGLLILEPKVFGDDRGWFMESFNQKLLSKRYKNVDWIFPNSFKTIILYLKRRFKRITLST